MTNRPIGIVACGLRNIASVQPMFEAVECDADIIANPSDIDRCGKLVLPGIGAFDEGMRLFDEGGWKSTASLQGEALTLRQARRRKFR